MSFQNKTGNKKQNVLSPMKKSKSSIIFILVISICLLALALNYVGNFFSHSYLPPEITITRTQISSRGGFTDPVTIEKLLVDSFGKEGRPVSYTIELLVTCTIKHKKEAQTAALNEIKLDKAGSYNWTMENVHIPILHLDSLSERTCLTKNAMVAAGKEGIDICPIKFENDSWYFVSFGDPVFIGIYIHIDTAGIMLQYPAYSRKLHI